MKALTFLAPLLAAALVASANAGPLRSAQVTKAVNDVRIYQPAADGRPANLGDTISGASSLHTGHQSRAELTFQDSTLTRVGANSVFSFRTGSRDLEIGQGTILLQVPKNAGGATIRTATVTAAITGTTTLMEYNPKHWVKFITLEGTAKLALGAAKDKKVKFVDIPAGHMIVMHPDATRIPAPVVINLAKLVATSGLAGRSRFGPLPAKAQQFINQAVANQMAQRKNGDLMPTDVVIRGAAGRGSNTVPPPDITTVIGPQESHMHQPYPPPSPQPVP